jgi:hypothetical protein
MVEYLESCSRTGEGKILDPFSGGPAFGEMGLTPADGFHRIRKNKRFFNVL